MRTSYQIDPNAIDAVELRERQLREGQPQPLALPPSLQEGEHAPPRLRIRGLFVLAGFAFGVLLGEVFYGGPFPAALVGLTGGLLVELLSSRR